MQQVYSTFEVYSNNELRLLRVSKIVLFFKILQEFVSQEPGWNEDVIEWCAKEAKRQDFKPHDYWGGFIIDEMKLQVSN